jgi:hypothetical protein
MKRIDAYVDNNGGVHKTAQEARDEDVKAVFRKSLKYNTGYFWPSDVVHFLKTNRKDVREYLDNL